MTHDGTHEAGRFRAGRFVIFHSGKKMHEVLPCTQGQRLALTLWVEYVRDDSNAEVAEGPTVPGNHFTEPSR